MKNGGRGSIWKWGIRARVVVPLICICLLLSLVCGSMIQHMRERQSRDHLAARAAAIAHAVVNYAAPYGTLAVLSALFISVAILTNLLTNAATAILFSPIALSAATELGVHDPLPFLLAVIYGANCSFATPFAYQTNMLVMGPGHYKFGDFMKFGVPLVLLLWCVFTLFAPWRFDL